MKNIMKNTILQRFCALTLALIVLLTLAGCGGPVPPKSQPGAYTQITFDFEESVGTKQFKSVDELNSFTKNYEGSGPAYYIKGMGRGLDIAVAEEMAVAPAMDATASKIAAAPADYSQTNVQVAGVDEGDILKT